MCLWCGHRAWWWLLRQLKKKYQISNNIKWSTLKVCVWPLEYRYWYYSPNFKNNSQHYSWMIPVSLISRQWNSISSIPILLPLLLHHRRRKLSPPWSHVTKQHTVENLSESDCVGEGEPVACVVNSRYFQHSLTWGNLTLSLDPVWVILVGVVYMCVCVWKENECDWIYPADRRTVVLFTSSGETPDCDCTMSTLALTKQLNIRIRSNNSIM